MKGKLWGDEQGQALVEFAIISVILLLIAGGVVDAARIMRSNVVLSGAVADVTTQVTIDTATTVKLSALCNDVLTNNYGSTLADGNTVVSYKISRPRDDNNNGLGYSYHDKSEGTWNGTRKYVLVSIEMEREEKLLTPAGVLFFSDPMGTQGIRTLMAQGSVRVYFD